MRTLDLPSRETIAAFLHAPPAPASPGPARNKSQPYPKHPEFAGLDRIAYQAAYQAARRKLPGYKEQHTKYTREWRWALRVKEEAV